MTTEQVVSFVTVRRQINDAFQNYFTALGAALYREPAPTGVAHIRNGVLG